MRMDSGGTFVGATDPSNQTNNNNKSFALEYLFTKPIYFCQLIVNSWRKHDTGHNCKSNQEQGVSHSSSCRIITWWTATTAKATCRRRETARQTCNTTHGTHNFVALPTVYLKVVLKRLFWSFRFLRLTFLSARAP